MPERTYNREGEIDATRASARLPGLDIVEAMECVLRTEADVPVPGFAVALRKPE